MRSLFNTLLAAIISPKTAISSHPRNMFSTISNKFRDVHIVPMFDDNYGYVLVDKASNHAAIVDPGDASVFPRY